MSAALLPASTSGSPFPSLDEAFPPAGLGIEAGKQDSSKGLVVCSQLISRAGLIHQTKLRREPEEGAPECEATQPQGDISPSGKKPLWGGRGGSALPGGLHPNARDCTRNLGAFSSARASSQRGACAAGGEGWAWGCAAAPSPGHGTALGVQPGSPPWHCCPQHLPGMAPVQRARGCCTPRPTVPDPPGGPAAPLAVMSQRSPMMSQAVAMEIA